jgi:hypothetical protein
LALDPKEPFLGCEAAAKRLEREKNYIEQSNSSISQKVGKEAKEGFERPSLFSFLFLFLFFLASF